jgi:hypothetical protein
MKRIIAVIALMMLMASFACAAGSVTFTTEFPNRDRGYAIITISWTGDASTGSVPSTEFPDISSIRGYYIIKASTKPGTVNPTALYDIAINNEIGDIMGGALGNLAAATASTNISPLDSGGMPALVPVDGPLTFVLTNNSVNSATGTVKLYFVR